MLGRRAKAKDDYHVNSEELPTAVYVAHCDGRTKIGIADDVERRIRQLTNASGARVELLASRVFSTRLSANHVEKELHKRFRLSRLSGEWFRSRPRKVVAALEGATDPCIHIADYRPGMPVEVASAGIIERWDWCETNGLPYKYRAGTMQFAPPPVPMGS